MFDRTFPFVNGIEEILAKVVPAMAPRLATRACTRAGLDEAVLSGPHKFDKEHYELAVNLKFASIDAALYHYLRIGSRRDIAPHAGFSPEEYRRRNPDIAFVGYEAFAHYLRFGRDEGRDDAHVAEASMPDTAQMLQRPRPLAVLPSIDVVIPVYGSRALTLRTIESVLAAQVHASFELTVIDDASPDPLLRNDLERLARQGLVTLVTNDRNVGFVASANRGLALHDTRDVVLLNSDTQVFTGWLDRLVAALYSGPRVGTATPLSNAATILSYPIMLRDNHRPPKMGFAALDKLCADLGQVPIEIPTAIGFCMAVKRSCLREIGLFDVAHFGRGYGEENDFCLRATSAGWHHVAATDVFVWHRGGGSFGAERDARISEALSTLERLHPGCGDKVRRFVQEDPLKFVRARLDAARLFADPRRKILLIESSCFPDQRKEVGELILRVVPDVAPFWGQYRIVANSHFSLPNLPRLLPTTQSADLAQMLRGLGIEEVRLGGPGGVPEWIRRIFATAAKIGGIGVIQQYDFA